MKSSARTSSPALSPASTRAPRIVNVEADVAGQRLVALITVEVARDLGLEEGKSVTAIVKASDVILAAD